MNKPVENSEYVPVTSTQERARVLEDLKSKATVLAGLTEDQHQFSLQLRHVADETVYVDILPPASRALKVGETIQILFGLPDGLFLIRTAVAAANYDEASFAFGTDLHRLQRRNNFRTMVPPTYRMVFRVNSIKTSVQDKGAQISPVDISAGGMRLKWPAAKLTRPVVGDGISGVLVIPGGKQIEVFGLVRTVMTADATSFHIGIEFQNLSLRDEQTILFVCVQIHREQQSYLK